jgi:hypothetical protein
MGFRRSPSAFASVLVLVIAGLARLQAQDAGYPTAAPPAQGQPGQTDAPPTLPAKTQDPGETTHGHQQDQNTGRNAHDSGHGAEIAGIAGGAVATGIVIDLIHQHEVVNKLKSHGPQLPKAFDMNNLHVTGFVQDGWPIAIEYALPGTVDAHCIITTSHKRGSFALPPTGGARHIVKLTGIPSGFSEKPGVADYWIRLDASPLPVSSSGWPGLRIYGVAAGPHAVGSVAIDQVSLAPTDKAIRVSAGDVALFGFHSHSDFDSVIAEFWLVAPNQGRNLLTVEETENVPPVSEDEHVQGLRWQPQSVRSGDHILRIVAWRGIDRGADWVSTMSADMVSVER